MSVGLTIRKKLDRLESRVLSERDSDALRKRRARAESARVFVGECGNPDRREACLADPKLFLTTYFPERYKLKFNAAHEFMIEEIVSRAKHGGRQAIAAPRGIGKSELVKGLIVYVVLAELVRFPLAVAATTTLAGRIYADFRRKIENNDLLKEDFPEVCDPVRALEGAPQRASRQHVDGIATNIVWTSEYCCLPHVVGSPYGGVKMAYYGLDSAFRGVNIDADRPDFILIDDPETRESARSEMQSEDREQIIDRDIAGLAGQEQNIAIVALTTVQNRKSLSYRLTTPELKQSFNGRKFGMVQKWPADTELWERYIEIRQNAQIRGDQYGTEAVDFYLEHQDRMDAGVEMLSDHFVPIEVEGRQMVHSAIQQAYNRIADTSRDSYFTEYQNDPPEDQGPEGLGLTPEIVASRLSGLEQRQLPANTTTLTAAIDLGKYKCHWVVCAWWKGAGGCVVDYGIAEVANTTSSMDDASSEPHVYRTLLDWREQLLATEYVDATGQMRKLDCVFVDSGAYTNSAYEFARQVGAPFFPVKGVAKYREKRKASETVKPGDHMDASYQSAERLWLFNLSVDYWKNWVHERFLTPTFDEQNMLRRGSLSLFALPGRQVHKTFARHICAEELVSEFEEGKGSKTYWHQHEKNNHFLDAVTYAAAAGRYAGVRLLTTSEVKNQAKMIEKPKRSETVAKNKRHHGANLQRRPGGWMQSIRRQ